MNSYKYSTSTDLINNSQSFAISLTWIMLKHDHVEFINLTFFNDNSGNQFGSKKVLKIDQGAFFDRYGV